MEVPLDQKLTRCKKLATVCQMTFGQSTEQSALRVSALAAVPSVLVHAAGPCSPACQVSGTNRLI